MRCGYDLKDIGRSLSWGALRSFIENIGPESATARSVDPDVYEWSTTTKTNVILADIYDMLAMINANLVASASKKHTKKPKFYPRPKADDSQHYGKDPVSVEELRNRFAESRKRHKHGRH